MSKTTAPPKPKAPPRIPPEVEAIIVLDGFVEEIPAPIEAKHMTSVVDDPTSYLKRDIEVPMVLLAPNVTVATGIAKQYGIAIQVNSPDPTTGHTGCDYGSRGTTSRQRCYGNHAMGSDPEGVVTHHVSDTGKVLWPAQDVGRCI